MTFDDRTAASAVGVANLIRTLFEKDPLIHLDRSLARWYGGKLGKANAATWLQGSDTLKELVRSMRNTSTLHPSYLSNTSTNSTGEA